MNGDSRCKPKTEDLQINDETKHELFKPPECVKSEIILDLVPSYIKSEDSEKKFTENKIKNSSTFLFKTENIKLDHLENVFKAYKTENRSTILFKTKKLKTINLDAMDNLIKVYEKEEHLNTNLHDKYNMYEDDKLKSIPSKDGEQCFDYDLNHSEIAENKKRKAVKRVQNEKEYICAHCTFTSARRKTFIEHVKKHRPTREFKCAHCNYVSSRKNTLMKHVFTHPESSASKSGEGSYKCSHCTTTYKYRYNLIRHISKSHTDSTKSRPFKCTCCDFAFYSLSELSRHVLTHTRQLPYQCTYCNYAASRSYSLKLHTFIKHAINDFLICPICEKKYSKGAHLKKHLDTECGKHKEINVQKEHSDGKILKNTCVVNKKSHMRLQKNKPLFQCDSCGYATSNHSLLKYHIVTKHTKEPIFKCMSCDYSSFRIENLRKHRLNLDHDVFNCEHCDYRGLRYLDMEKHMKTHFKF